MTNSRTVHALVDTDWLADHLADPAVRVFEVNEDLSLYPSGHVYGAILVDSRKDFWDPVVRDFIGPQQFAELMGRWGVSKDTTVVLYGDKSNWWATYAYWFLKYNGHHKVKLVDGGRQKLVQDGFDFTPDTSFVDRAPYPVGQRDERLRIYRDDVLRLIETTRAGAGAMVDVRSPEEYAGFVTHMPDYPQEGVLRGGHIPGAVNVPWAMTVKYDGTFKSLDQLRRLFEPLGVTPDREVVTYCRIAERSSHTWFVLSELLGYPRVRNYDGSWTEWGNAVRVPIERGLLGG
ncbi:sulfurtransferase [Deinococcus yavapaiensis]|uniref:Sulfurtransferase n=1 Tax=Deinococcus yavapaiensis KR-236 TaxID=694435 RepID=A0A318S4P3_9DEIO|nr:sulfurtransferase [Deinococcus yavapaiensis]PYE51950.1 thiosulfate/3-mercaptopyruvate sulfurtransferase [Deinococcus yavapaiensis KR-236]